MKKFANFGICVVNFICGVLGLALLPVTGIKLNILILNCPNKIVLPASDILKPQSIKENTPDYIINSFIKLKIVAYVAVVIYCLLILASVVVFILNLKNIKKGKTPITITIYVLITLLVVASIFMIIFSKECAINMAIQTQDSMKFFKVKTSGEIGLYQPIMLGITTFTFIITSIMFILKIKK